MLITHVYWTDEDTETYPAIYHNATGTFDAVYSKWTYCRGFETEEEARAWLVEVAS
jgi:hypothetical protein